MSTKATISHGDDYHLYEEAFDNTCVYLRLDDCKELVVKSGHYDDMYKQQITVGIPIEIWRHAVSDWLESRWANNSERDNASLESNSMHHFEQVLK